MAQQSEIGAARLLLVLTPLLAWGCQMGVSEKGKDRCLAYASRQKNDFTAKKIYDRCLKTVMAEIRDEEKEAERRKAELNRIARLNAIRTKALQRQNKKLRKYTDWEYWPGRLSFDNSTGLPASCIASTESGTVTLEIVSLEDSFQNFRECMVTDSLHFTKTGFRVASIFSHVTEEVQSFDVGEHDVDCGASNKGSYRNLATLLGQAGGGVFKDVETVTDPFSRARLDLKDQVSVSAWESVWRDSQGLSKEVTERMVKPLCRLQRKFWNDSEESFVKSFAG